MTIARYFRLTVTGVNINSLSPFVAALELRTAADGTGANLALTGSGTASASSFAVGQEASKAFDNNAASYWAPTTTNSGWLKWDFGGPVDINHIRIQNSDSSDSFSIIAGYVDSSNDDATWSRLVTLYSMNIVKGVVNAFTAQPLGGAPGIPLPSPYQIVMYGGGSSNLSMPKLRGANYAGANGAATLPRLSFLGEGADKVVNKASILLTPQLVGYGSATAEITVSPTLSLYGNVSIVGRASLAATTFSVSGRGVLASKGSIGAAMPMSKMVGYSGAVLAVSLNDGYTLAASGAGGAVGRCAVILPLFKLTASGEHGEHGALDASLPMLSAVQGGMAWLPLPNLKLTAIGSATVVATYEAYAVNLNHTSDSPVDEVTHYTNFPFDRIVRYKNSYFGMNSTGLYLLEGTTDNGTPTSYAVQTHKTDFDSPEHKTVVSLYMGGRVGPAETVSVIAGETAPQAYSYTTPRGPLAQNYRQKFGRGIKSRYYAFGVSGNTNFKLDAMEPEINKLTRRI